MSGAPRGLGRGEHLAEDGHLLHADIARLVGGRAPQEDDVKGKGFEAQIFRAVDRHDFDQVVPGAQALASPASLAKGAVYRRSEVL